MQACSLNPELQSDQKTNLNQAAAYNTQLGLSYLKQGSRPRAKKKLLLALKQSPHSPDVNAAMAYYFEQTHELDQAKKYYLKALSLSDQDGAQLNNYGAFLCRQAQYKQSEAYFLKAIKDEQYLHTSAAYENAGLCALASPDYKKARLYFKAALNQDPTRNGSLYELVKLENQLGNSSEAVRLLKKFPKLVLNDGAFLTLAKKIAKKTDDDVFLKSLEKNAVT